MSEFDDKVVSYFNTNFAANESHDQKFIKICRDLRNAVILNENAYLDFLKNDLILNAFLICRNAALNSEALIDNNAQFDYSSVILLVCQLICNFSSRNNVCKDFLFSSKVIQYIPDLFVAATKFKSRKALAAVIAMIYNCIHDKNDLNNKRLDKFCCTKNILNQLFLSFIAQNDSPTCYQNYASVNCCDIASEWMHILMFYLIQKKFKILEIFKIIGYEKNDYLSIKYSFDINIEQVPFKFIFKLNNFYFIFLIIASNYF
jgi:hypothetical protein